LLLLLLDNIFAGIKLE